MRFGGWGGGICCTGGCGETVRAGAAMVVTRAGAAAGIAGAAWGGGADVGIASAATEPSG